jgi:hypothetical protein
MREIRRPGVIGDLQHVCVAIRLLHSYRPIRIMAADSSARRQPTFSKVEQLRPGTHGHNLVVKVLDSKMVLQRGRAEGGRQQMRIAECLVGDETGIVVFTARNDQGTKPRLLSFIYFLLSEVAQLEWQIKTGPCTTLDANCKSKFTMYSARSYYFFYSCSSTPFCFGTGYYFFYSAKCT